MSYNPESNTKVKHLKALAARLKDELEISAEDKAKLDGIAEGATKVEASETDGAVKINGVDVQVVAIATDAEVAEMLNEVFGTGGEADA